MLNFCLVEDFNHFFDGCTCWSSSGYAYTIDTLRGSASEKGFYWDAFFTWVYYWLTCWSFYWYAPLTGNIGGTAGEVAFPNISTRDLNDSLCEFPSVTSGIYGAGLCIAQIKSCVASIVAYVEDIFGMLIILGVNYTVSDIRSTLVLGIYSLWHL